MRLLAQQLAMGRQFADTRRIAMGTVSAWPNRAGAHAAFADHLLNELDTVVNTAPNQSSASVGKLRYYLLTYAECEASRKAAGTTHGFHY